MPTPSRTSVELIQAFMWTCPECGRDRFERSIIVELSPEEMQELREDHGVEVWENGHFCRAPKRVHCGDCDLDFSTVDFGEDDAA